MTRRRHAESGAGRTACMRPTCRASAGSRSGTRIRRSSRRCARRARCSTPRSTSTATCTAGGTRRRSSIARRRSGSPAWTTSRLPRREAASTLRATALRGHRGDGILSRRGARRGFFGMIANRPDWTLSRQRQWGVPLPFFVDKDDRRVASGYAGAARACGGEGRAWRHRDMVRGDARGFRRRSGEIPQAHRHARRLVRLRDRRIRRYWADRKATRAARTASGRRTLSRRPVPRRLGPASRLVPLVAAGLVHAERRAAVQGAPDARLHRRRRRQEDVEVEGQRRRAAEGRPTRSAPRSCGCGSRRPIIRATCRSPTRS